MTTDRTDIKAIQTPAALGYRMPAEWEPHAATWLAWPHNRSDWPGKFHVIPWVFAEIVRHLSRVERVEILVQDSSQEARARSVLQQAGVAVEADSQERVLANGVRFHHWPTDRCWTRDSGAIFVRRDSDAELAAVKFRFNAWAKYSDSQRDDTVASKMARAAAVPQFDVVGDRDGVPQPFVLEGGSIDVNGRGALLTTEECLLSEVQQRNPGATRDEIERVLGDFLGISKVIWLNRGIAGDDTHGHVDDIARFVAPDAVVTVVENDRSDANYEPLQENLARLQNATDQDGSRLRVVQLPLPAPVYFRRRRLPASYANFYIANEIVLVPGFNDANDVVAMNILAELLPDRQVIGIYCGDLIWGLGALHCLTQQQPAR